MEKRQAAVEAHYANIKKHHTKYAKEIIKEFKDEGLVVYVFEYADEIGESVLEHGEIFKRAPKCMQISNH